MTKQTGFNDEDWKKVIDITNSISNLLKQMKENDMRAKEIYGVTTTAVLQLMQESLENLESKSEMTMFEQRKKKKNDDRNFLQRFQEDYLNYYADVFILFINEKPRWIIFLFAIAMSLALYQLPFSISIPIGLFMAFAGLRSFSERRSKEKAMDEYLRKIVRKEAETQVRELNQAADKLMVLGENAYMRGREQAIKDRIEKHRAKSEDQTEPLVRSGTGRK